MILRTIQCERTGCTNSFTEGFENQGFPGWGHIVGMIGQDASGHEITITFCPACFEKLIDWMKNG